MKRFTLHIRLTKRCTAECTYCSSWQEKAIPYMSEADFSTAMNFISHEVLPLFGYKEKQKGFATIQYVGGEILTIPRKILRSCVFEARNIMAQHFTTVIDGVQSNLIGNPQRLKNLHTLFGKRIGTSIDNFSNHRRLGGSAEKYRTAAAKGRATLNKYRSFSPPAIFVVDKDGLKNLNSEIKQAEKQNYDLTLRPAFEGGSNIESASKTQLAQNFGEVFDDWLLKSNIRIEPHYKLLTSRLATHSKNAKKFADSSGCPFQNNCAKVSLDLEPNGDLFVCLDMADSNQYCIGNAIKGTFNHDIWQELYQRQNHLDNECQNCKWLKECQGGCMSEAIHHTGSIYGHTELCNTWKTIFSRIDKAIENHGITKIEDWLYKLDEPQGAKKETVLAT